jgi:small subunit ribosomal protein S2
LSQTPKLGERGRFAKVSNKQENTMAYITMKELLEAGVHFGHQTKRWNPKMKEYIFGARNGIYIVDLQKTVRMFKVAYDFVVDIASKGQSVLFVGTKKQARESIYEEANRCEMYYVHNRWLGGMLTNFQTMKQSIKRLNYLNTIENDGSIDLFPKKERIKFAKERTKLDNTLGGIRTMTNLPGVIFVVDSKNEAIAVSEGKRLGIPIIGIVDTNSDPDEIDYVVPGNDDAIRAIRLFSSRIADACIQGRALYEEKKQAQADKGIEKESDVASEKVEMGQGERRIISDGSKGPIIEIIKRSEGGAQDVRLDSDSGEDQALADVEG